MNLKQYIPAGKIINTHGIKGQVKIEVWLDSPAFFMTFKTMYREDRSPMRAVSSFARNNFVVAGFEGINDIDSAIPLKNQILYIDRFDAPAGYCFQQDLIGCRVLDQNGNEIGIITDILEKPASDVYVVSGEEEHLIPAVKQFIQEIDTAEGFIRVNLIEGM